MRYRSNIWDKENDRIKNDNDLNQRHEDQDTELLNLLVQERNKDASKDCDKVYALLAIAKGYNRV